MKAKYRDAINEFVERKRVLHRKILIYANIKFFVHASKIQILIEEQKAGG